MPAHVVVLGAHVRERRQALVPISSGSSEVWLELIIISRLPYNSCAPMAGNDFKAFIFKELGDIRMEMAENA